MRLSPALGVALLPLLLAVAAIRLSPATGGVAAPTPSEPVASGAALSGALEPGAAGIEVQKIDVVFDSANQQTTVAVVALVQIAAGRPPLGVDPALTEIVLYDETNQEVGRGAMTVAIPRRLDPGVHVGIAGTIEVPAGTTSVRAELTRIGISPTLLNYAPASFSYEPVRNNAGVATLVGTLAAPTGAQADAVVEGYSLLLDEDGRAVALFWLSASPMGGATRSVELSPVAVAGDPFLPTLGLESAYAVQMP